MQDVSNILFEIKKFFRSIGYIFGAYVIVIAIFYNKISDIQALDWISTFFLVVVISLSTFAQYFIGISYNTLLYASQRSYITNAINIITVALNAILVLILCKYGCNVIIVKLVSSCVFVLRPIGSYIYVRKTFNLYKVSNKHTKALEQKWTGLGQHLAYFLHTNTDVVVLTVFGNLTMVAVYSVYHMVVSSIENFVSSCLSGMESLCGELIAKDEIEKVNSIFSYYQTFISVIITTLFSCTICLILSFVKLYTAKVHDADYYAPWFAMILIVAAITYCVRAPYHSVVIAAGHFQQTKYAAYGEAVINMLLSIVLVYKLGLIGVAIGTVVATLFRLVFYVIYISNNVLKRSIWLFIRREVVNLIIITISSLLGLQLLHLIDINNYFNWAVGGIIVSFETICITLLVNWLFYKKCIIDIFVRMRAKLSRR